MPGFGMNGSRHKVAKPSPADAMHRHAITRSRSDAVVLDRGGHQRNPGCSAESALSSAAALFTPTTIQSR
jgi:hypothetical protein